jgi:hypothetical protein
LKKLEIVLKNLEKLGKKNIMKKPELNCKKESKDKKTGKTADMLQIKINILVQVKQGVYIMEGIL